MNEDDRRRQERDSEETGDDGDDDSREDAAVALPPSLNLQRLGHPQPLVAQRPAPRAERAPVRRHLLSRAGSRDDSGLRLTGGEGSGSFAEAGSAASLYSGRPVRGRSAETARSAGDELRRPRLYERPPGRSDASASYLTESIDSVLEPGSSLYSAPPSFASSYSSPSATPLRQSTSRRRYERRPVVPLPRFESGGQEGPGDAEEVSSEASMAYSASLRAHPLSELRLVYLVGRGTFGKVFLARRLRSAATASSGRARLRSDESPPILRGRSAASASAEALTWPAAPAAVADHSRFPSAPLPTVPRPATPPVAFTGSAVRGSASASAASATASSGSPPHSASPDALQPDVSRPQLRPPLQALRASDEEMASSGSSLGLTTVPPILGPRSEDDPDVLAVKIVPKRLLRTTSLRRQAAGELRALRAVSGHPFIARLLFAYQTQRKMYIGLEFCRGGELFGLMSQQRLELRDAALIVMEVALALEHLHAHNIVFRDLKPENIALSEAGHAKLVDFGLSVVLEDPGSGGDNEQQTRLPLRSQVITSCGTLAYSAPEVLRRWPHAYEADWWSLGVILYELAVGFPPFDAEDPQDLCDRICTSDFEPVAPILPGTAAMDLVSRLLDRDQRARLGFRKSDAKLILEHAFFRDLGLLPAQVLALEVPAPHLLLPAPAGLEDVSRFDPVFTTAPAVDGNESSEEEDDDEVAQERQERLDALAEQEWLDGEDDGVQGVLFDVPGYEKVPDRTIRTALLR